MDISRKIVENRLELRNYMQLPGNEYPAFSCEVWHKGRKAALVTNDGNGGSNHYVEYKKGIVELLESIGREIEEYDAADHAVAAMIEMMDRSRQVIRWAAQGYRYVAEVVFRDIDLNAKPPVFDYEVKMTAAASKEEMIERLSKLKKPFKKAYWVNPDGSLGDEIIIEKRRS